MEVSKRQGLILRAMIHMGIVDGRVADDEITRIRWICRRIFDAELPDDVVHAAVAEVSREGGLEAFLQRCADELDVSDRRQLLLAAYAIATADGDVCAVEHAMLVRFARSLDVPATVYRSLLSPFTLARELVM